MATAPSTNINIPYSAFIEPSTGRPTQAWLAWLMSPNFISINLANAIPVTSGGTGLSTIPTDGQLLIGNGTGYTLNTLGYGAGISVVNGSGTITVANTGVLSFSAGTTGLLPSSVTTGNITLSGTLLAKNGGTGFSSYTIGDLLYADTTTTLAKLPDVAIGNVLLSGGVNAAPTWGKVDLTTHVTGVLPVANGGTNISSYTAGDILYATGATTLTKLAKPSATAMLIMDSAGVPSWKIPRYGAFHDTTAQSAAANTPTAITYNTTDFSNNVSIGAPTSRIVMGTAGLYNIQFSIQFTNSAASLDDAAVWLRVNGTDVPASTSWIATPQKHGGTNGQIIMALNFFYQFNANDYFELIWMTVGGTTSIETIPASAGVPAYPAAPSVILTVSDNIAA